MHSPPAGGNINLCYLLPKATNYPSPLRRCSDDGHLPTIATIGDLAILNSKLIGFFCSVRCPGDAILKTFDLARAFRSEGVPLIGGFQSPMEKEFLNLVLRGTVLVHRLISTLTYID